MNVIPQKILEDINSKIRSREIFQWNREFLVKSLIKASIKVQIMAAYTTSGTNLVDQFIEQFKAILKFIFSADNKNGTIPSNENLIIDELCNMILEFTDKYTPIRNYLDQCILGIREIRYDQHNNLYFEDSYDNYSNYARMLDKIKTHPSEDLKQEVQNKINSYVLMNNFKPNIFKDRYFYGLMNDYIDICWLESEIKFNHDFGTFTYEEMITFCASLKLMADYYQLFMIKHPCPIIEYEILVRGISRLTDLPREKVEIFLKYQTYDYLYQKDKITLIQGLIRFENKIYFNPTTLSIGLLPIKMYRLIVDYDNKKYEKDISMIANLKEKQMTEEIANQLAKYDLIIKSNYKIKNGNKNLAEYDMLIFDNKTNNIYICEFKWYFIGDGEREHKYIDDKIRDAIRYRKRKNKLILDNPQILSDELFTGAKVNNIYEILVSQNFSGGRKQNMTVIDFLSLKRSIEKYDNFEELMEYFLSNEYRKSIPIKTSTMSVDIEGYKFVFYRMYMS